MKAGMIFDKAKSIDHRTIGGEAFIIAGGNEASIHSLNEVGTFVFDACDGKTPLDAIVEAVVTEFEIDRATAEADVKEFALALEARGMLERCL